MLSIILVLSLVLGILPLLGVVWTLTNGMITTVDGLFTSLILLTLSGTFLLNAYWEMRDKGMIGKRAAGGKTTVGIPPGKEKAAAPSTPPPPKAS